MLQSCSGHSSSTGEIGHGVTAFTFFGICTFSPVTGLITFCVADVFLSLLLPLLSLPLLLNDGGGLSSFDLRFSARGGRNSVGDVDGVLLHVLLPELLDELPPVAVIVVVIVLVVGVVVLVDERPARPLAFALRNLL